MIEFPCIVINFKTYENGTGIKAEKLVQSLNRIAERKNVVLAVQNADIYRLSKYSLPVFAQHIDASGYGQFTGKDIGETLKYNGAQGVIINHSEDRIEKKIIRQSILFSKEAGLISLVCAHIPALAKQISRLMPDIIAIEPPELIGTGISVSQAKPRIITQTTSCVNLPVLCGAGITTKDDVEKALQLGCKGVLVSSAIMKAKNPGNVLKKYIKVLRRYE